MKFKTEEYIVLVFEVIFQGNNVWMLSNLKHFDHNSGIVDLGSSFTLFLNYFDCNLFLLFKVQSLHYD